MRQSRRKYHGGGFYNKWCIKGDGTLGEYFSQSSPFFQSDSTNKAVSLRCRLAVDVADTEFRALWGYGGPGGVSGDGSMYIGFTNQTSEEGDNTRIGIIGNEGATAHSAIGQTTNILLQEWVNVIIQVTSGGTLEIYINGILESLNWLVGSNTNLWPGNTDFNAPIQSIFMSSFISGTLASPLEGFVDEFQYWNKSLNAEEAFALHGSYQKDPRLLPFSSDLLSWTRMGDLRIDRSGTLEFYDLIRSGELYTASGLITASNYQSIGAI